jgi:hypothetical protein
MKTIKTSYKTSELLSNRLKDYHTKDLKRDQYNIKNNNYYFNKHIKSLLCRVRRKKTIYLTKSQYMLLSYMIDEIIDCNKLQLSSISLRKELLHTNGDKQSTLVNKQIVLLRNILKTVD